MKDEYAMFAFSLLRLRDTSIALYISSYFLPRFKRIKAHNMRYFNVLITLGKISLNVFYFLSVSFKENRTTK